MNYLEVLKQVQKDVSAFFETHTDPRLVYHNETHTQNVVKATTKIANHYQLEDREFFIVCTAAWFHDVGYHLEHSSHEQKGAEYAQEYLKQKDIDEDIIQKVKHCILATKIPQKPSSLLEEIVCDADLFHFGTDKFSANNKLMRKEFQAVKGIEINKDNWRIGTIKMLENHHYHTDFCRLLLTDKKQENVEKLKRKHLVQSPNHSNPLSNIQQETTNSQSGKEKKDRPERGIETMFRISSTNHQRLSDMADNKANILITVNAIIISAVISLLMRRLEEHIYLAAPTIILLTVSLITMIYSILATRPYIPSGTFTSGDVKEKKVNLLFFGNFYKMDLELYSAGMQKMMEDKDFLYGSLIRDLYSQGVVLGKKYRLLRIAYNVFMYGLIVSVLSFIIAALIHGKD